MIKNVCKKWLIISGLMIIFWVIILGNTRCFAFADVTDSNEVIWDVWSPYPEQDRDLLIKVEPIVGVIRVIGIIVSVGTIAYIGIKTMLGSIEEKANYKQRMLPWVLGATMVFAITLVPTIIYDISDARDEISDASIGKADDSTYYWDGFDDAIRRLNVSSLKENEEEDEDKVYYTIVNTYGGINVNNFYWQGYIAALEWVLQAPYSKIEYIKYYQEEYLKKIDNGSITKDTIIMEITEKALEMYQMDNGSYIVTEENDTRKIEGVYNRLLKKAQEWEIEVNTAANSIALYAKGYDDAITWISESQYASSNAPNPVLLRNAAKIEYEKIQMDCGNAYLYGYRAALVRFVKCTNDSAAHFYPETMLKMIEKIKNGEINQNNYESKDHCLSGPNGEFEGTFHRLIIQQLVFKSVDISDNFNLIRYLQDEWEVSDGFATLYTKEYLAGFRKAIEYILTLEDSETRVEQVIREANSVDTPVVYYNAYKYWLYKALKYTLITYNGGTEELYKFAQDSKRAIEQVEAGEPLGRNAETKYPFDYTYIQYKSCKDSVERGAVLWFGAEEYEMQEIKEDLEEILK